MSAAILFHKYASINEAPIYKNIKKKSGGQRAINKILVDAGPNSNIKNYLTQWQYSYLLNKNKKIHFDYVFISHFDFDHYAGIIDIINDNRFTFGTIFHNGIARFGDKDERPTEYNTDLGTTVGSRSKKYLITSFNSIQDIKALKTKGGFSQTFGYFCDAILNANNDNRLTKVKFANYTTAPILFENENKEFKISFLGPVNETDQLGKNKFKWFSDSSHTRNGHSLVLKLVYDKISILLTGDLNNKSQKHLLKHYKNSNPFLSDVSKGCHHGSSDFNINFLKSISPFSTVISSGDNESHSHPRADAIGATGKYSRGDLPKVYSTELARSINASGEVLYGMINLRTDGKQIYMAQMKEAKKPDIWDSYKILKD